MSEMKDKLHTGELYLPGDQEIMKEQVVYQDLLYEYNLTKPSETEKREKLLKEMLAECGEGVYIEAPFYANFGGHHCHFGKMVYANYHLTCVDDTHIYVGDYTMFGPNVTVAMPGKFIQQGQMDGRVHQALVFVLAVEIHQMPPDLRQGGNGHRPAVNVGFAFALAVQFAFKRKGAAGN